MVMIQAKFSGFFVLVLSTKDVSSTKSHSNANRMNGCILQFCYMFVQPIRRLVSNCPLNECEDFRLFATNLRCCQITVNNWEETFQK